MHQNLFTQNTIYIQLIIVGVTSLILGIVVLSITPLFLFIGIAGIIFVVIAWHWSEIALLVLLLISSTIFEIYGFPKIPIGIGQLIFTDVIELILIGIVIFRTIANRTPYFIHTPLDLPLLAFYSVALISTAIAIFASSVTFNQSLGEVRAVNLYLTFLIVTNLIRNEKQLYRLLNGILIFAFLVGLTMVAQYIVGPDNVILPTGRVETLVTAGGVDPGVTRILPPGQSLVLIVFIFQVVLLVIDRLSSNFLARVVLACWTGIAVLLTFNRNFWIVIILSLVITGILITIRDKIRFINIAVWVILLGAIILTTAVALIGNQAQELFEGSAIRLLTLVNPSTLSESSMEYRYIEYEYALPQIESHPLLGLGLGADYRPRDPRLDSRDINEAPLTYYIHNGHVWMILKTGLIGYLFFMWFLLRFVKRGFHYWKRIPDLYQQGIILSFTVTIVGILVASIVNPIFKSTFWTPVLGIMIGMSEVIFRINSDQTQDLITKKGFT